MIVHDVVALIIGASIGASAAGESPHVTIVPIVFAVVFLIGRIIEERYK